ncbi:hypothetical protein [Aurantimonas coralicida]|uniref:hypothetical protein n=1 Tax=Aurantimonas coralicida TaxID=182270 RepID=UPI001E463593|nr:hypothetical protein [Aurantimonas coralicida]MCD1644796.1 hypothetical protein [Aurantimonas coralicida]
MAERLRRAFVESIGSRRVSGLLEPERKASAGGFLDDAELDGGFVERVRQGVSGQDAGLDLAEDERSCIMRAFHRFADGLPQRHLHRPLRFDLLDRLSLAGPGEPLA